MREPGTPLTEQDFKPGLRVYVSDMDVFGTIDPSCLFVVCEHPMPGFHYIIGGKRRPILDADEVERANSR